MLLSLFVVCCVSFVVVRCLVLFAVCCCVVGDLKRYLVCVVVCEMLFVVSRVLPAVCCVMFGVACFFSLCVGC